MNWVSAVTASAFVAAAVLWLFAIVSILRYWTHFARWQRVEARTRPLPLYLDLLPITTQTYKRLFAKDQQASNGDRLAARRHLVRALLAGGAFAALVGVIFFASLAN